MKRKGSTMKRRDLDDRGVPYWIVTEDGVRSGRFLTRREARDHAKWLRALTDRVVMIEWVDNR